MNKRVTWLWVVLLVLALGLGFSAGCGKKKVSTEAGAGAGEGAAGALSAEERARLERERRLREARLKEEQARRASAKMRQLFENEDIYFDYDSYELKPEAKRILNDKAAYMKSNPTLRIIIEGHCDERGSNAYNMALGEKRARAARAYLSAMGIGARRIETVSYGEERPIAMGSTAEAYAKNRRAHFVIK